MKEGLKRMLAAVREVRNDIAARLDLLTIPANYETIFRCNVCGRMTRASKAALTREQPSCRCGSTVRLRSLVHLLTEALFGKSMAIGDIPLRPDIVGIDMSGASVYADRLVRRLGYTNFHGGEGGTLEMRVFSKSGLLRELTRAGFEDIRTQADTCDESDIAWTQPWSLPITARYPPG